MKELLKSIGKEGYITTEQGLKVLVLVEDVKSSYGKTRYLVTPVKGKGSAWVENIEFAK